MFLTLALVNIKSISNFGIEQYEYIFLTLTSMNIKMILLILGPVDINLGWYCRLVSVIKSLTIFSIMTSMNIFLFIIFMMFQVMARCESINQKN